MKQKNLFLASFLSVITFSDFLRLSNTFCAVDSDSKKNAILQILESQENAVWNLIAQETGITKKQCIQNQQEHLQEEALRQRKTNADQIKQSKPLSSAAQYIITKVLNDLDIDPQSIDIVPCKLDGDNLVRSDDWTLWVDEQNLLSHPVEIQYFAMMHEIMHIRFKDQSMKNALFRFMEKQKITNKEEKNLVDQAAGICKQSAMIKHFQRFLETRADVAAMLMANVYTQGAVEWFTLVQERDGKNHGPPLHPENAERLAWAKAIQNLVYQ